MYGFDIPDLERYVRCAHIVVPWSELGTPRARVADEFDQRVPHLQKGILQPGTSYAHHVLKPSQRNSLGIAVSQIEELCAEDVPVEVDCPVDIADRQASVMNSFRSHAASSSTDGFLLIHLRIKVALIAG
jgi:hypothetical protein